MCYNPFQTMGPVCVLIGLQRERPLLTHSPARLSIGPHEFEMTAIRRKFILSLCDISYMRIFGRLPVLSAPILGLLLRGLLLPLVFLRHLEILCKGGDFLCIPHLDLVLTTRCTLKCKNCNNLMPHYKEAVSFSIKELNRDLDFLLSAVDLIYEVRILGGEPFLHPGWTALLSRCLTEPKITTIRVITNGTVGLSAEDKDFLTNLSPSQKRRILFYISDYPVVNDQHKKKLLAMLEKIGIAVYRAKALRWHDAGLFHDRGYAVGELMENYASCSLCVTLFNHEISMCARSAHGAFLGLIPNAAADHVQLLQSSPADIRRKLHALFARKYVSSCGYCDNMRDIRVPPAEQLR